MVSLLRITWLRTLYLTDSNIIPLQLLQLVRSPLLGSLTTRLVFQDRGASSDSRMSCRMSVSNVAVICSSTFSISPYIWSIPGVFLSFNAFIALLTSSTLGGSVSMSSNSGDGMMISSVSGSSQFSTRSHLNSALVQSVPSNISVHARLLRSCSLVALSHACLLIGTLSLLVTLLESPCLVLRLLSPLPLLFFRYISSCLPWYSF